MSRHGTCATAVDRVLVRGPGRQRGWEEGFAVVMVMIATSFVGAMVAAVALLSAGEGLFAARHRDVAEARVGAQAAADVVAAALDQLAEWDSVLAGTTASGFVDATTTPVIAGRGRVDLTEETRRVQAASDAAGSWGADAPRWVIVAYGPASALAPDGTSASQLYLAAWVADDHGDGDGDPLRDSNGKVQVRADALGGFGARHTVWAVYDRMDPAPAPIRRLAWRHGS